MTTENEYQVWECRILVPKSFKLPMGMDSPPRRAAIEACEQAGVPVASCFSGWGHEPTAAELRVMEYKDRKISS